MSEKRQLRVAIIGAGISGLTIANSLILDKEQRFDVKVYERDGVHFKEDRQGYLLTICDIGLSSLRYSTDAAGWEALRQAWGEEVGKGSALVDPKTGKMHCQLSEVRNYPAFRRISRQNLRGVLRQLPEEEGCIRYNCPLDAIEMVSTSVKGQHEVKLSFQNPDTNPPAVADIVIAADGSYSRAHDILNLQNKFELTEWTLIQTRSLVDEAKLKTLPQQFNETGRSWLFIGGSKLGGFVNAFPMEQPIVPAAQRDAKGSTTGSEADLVLKSDPRKLYRLFCDFNVPRAVGDRILKQANGNEDIILDLLCKYVIDDLKYDPSGVPAFIRAAPKHVRTGRLTSSREPVDRDWRRKRAPEWGRILLIGDAIHPMPPGRGMGANQALTDAHKLSMLLHEAADRAGAASSTLPDFMTDKEALSLARAFEDEMYVRAFDMVKQSEQSMLYDLTSASGRVKLRAALALFEAAHSATSFVGKLWGRSAKTSDDS